MPSPQKTDQEILDELKAASGGEKRRSAGLTAFVILLAIVIGVFTFVNRRAEQANNANNRNSNSVATENNSNNAANENNSTDNAANETNETNTANETSNTNGSNETNTANTTDTTTLGPTASGEALGEEPTVGSTHSDTEYTEVAQVGEGVTHLARRALAAYANEKGISDLTAEHKIYIEDYLAKASSPVLLDIGNSRTFSTTLVDEAIASARTLTATDLQNLQQYSALVPGL